MDDVVEVSRRSRRDGLRARALVLRSDGWSVNDIASTLGVARSTAWSWVRMLPLDPESERVRSKREHAKAMAEARWSQHRAERDARRETVRAGAARFVGGLTTREVLLFGMALYWCEGAKQKPRRPFNQLIFTNSDPRLVALYLAFLTAVGVRAADVRLRLYIHQTADAEAAREWWSEVVGVPVSAFQPTSFKRHRPNLARHNVGDEYHGCLAVTVRRGRDLYWWIDGALDAVLPALPATAPPGPVVPSGSDAR